jgi:hypothetical protein
MFRRFLAAAVVLLPTVALATPASAARCASNCPQIRADVSITAAWTTPAGLPLFPGSLHSYTARVTNTPWRTGGSSASTPWPTGPASGIVFVKFEPGTPNSETLTYIGVDIGTITNFGLAANGGAYCDTGNIPANTTDQITAFFYAPHTPGTYTFRIWLDPYQGIQPWTDYDPNNNEVNLSFQVGYLA